MTTVRTALLSILMLSGIGISGASIYAASAASGYLVVDGYGISAYKR